MTKRVRIESIDQAPGTITVEVWHKGAAGEPDYKGRENVLKFNGDSVEIAVWGDQHLVIKETAE